MAAKAILALLIAYAVTVLYIAAMCTPWWYTKYDLRGNNNNGNNNNGNNGDSNFLNSLNLSSDDRLFHRSNCFIDGSCISRGIIYKNNANLQWVYTTTLVLMIIGWIPWLIFVHLLHFRANKNRSSMKGRRTLMIITAILTMLFLLAAFITFATAIVKKSPVYNSGGLYGSRSSDGYYGSMPNGNLLNAGYPLLFSNNNNNNNYVNSNYNTNNNNNNGSQNGTILFKWGIHAGWYFAILAFALIPLALLLGLLIKIKDRVVRQDRTVTRTVTTQPAVVQTGIAPNRAV